MNKKYYYIIIIIVVAIIVLTLTNVFDFNTILKKNVSQNEDKVTGDTNGDNKDLDQEKNAQEKTQQEKEQEKINNLKAQIKIKARIFIEKYGTYSAYNKEENFNELNSLVSPALSKQLSKESQDIQKDLQSIETITASIQIKEFDIDKKIVCETEMRQIIEKEDDKSILYKNAEVSFEKIDNEWKINEFNIK